MTIELSREQILNFLQQYYDHPDIAQQFLANFPHISEWGVFLIDFQKNTLPATSQQLETIAAAIIQRLIADYEQISQHDKYALIDLIEPEVSALCDTELNFTPSGEPLIRGRVLHESTLTLLIGLLELCHKDENWLFLLNNITQINHNNDNFSMDISLHYEPARKLDLIDSLMRSTLKKLPEIHFLKEYFRYVLAAIWTFMTQALASQASERAAATEPIDTSDFFYRQYELKDEYILLSSGPQHSCKAYDTLAYVEKFFQRHGESLFSQDSLIYRVEFFNRRYFSNAGRPVDVNYRRNLFFRLVARLLGSFGKADLVIPADFLYYLIQQKNRIRISENRTYPNRPKFQSVVTSIAGEHFYKALPDLFTLLRFFSQSIPEQGRWNIAHIELISFIFSQITAEKVVEGENPSILTVVVKNAATKKTKKEFIDAVANALLFIEAYRQKIFDRNEFEKKLPEGYAGQATMSLIEALFPYSWEILFLKYGIENYHSQLGLMIEHAITQVLNRIKERIETQVLPDYYYRKVIQACERLLNKNPSATIYCQVIVLLYHEKIQAFHTRFFDDKQFLQKFLKIATVEFLLKKKSELCSTSLYNFLMTTLDRDNIPNLLVPIGTVRSHKIFNYIKNQDLKKYRELCILRYCYLHRYEISKKNDPDISVDLITKKLSDINPDSDNADLIDKIFYILEQISPVKHIARLLREYITLLTSNSLNARSTFTPEHLYDICLENPHAVTDIIQELCSLPINFSLYVLEPQWRTIIDSIREENDLSDNQEDILSKIAAFYNHSEVRLVIENPKDTRLRLGIDDNLDYEAVFDSGSDDLIDIDTDSSSQSLEPPVPPAERPVVVIESINFAQETVESIRERCAESLIQSADIFFGIHQKYSQDKTVPCVPEHIKSYNKRANKKSEKAILQKVTVLFEKIMEKTRNSDSYGRSEQNVQHEGYRLLLSGQLNKKLPAIVVFAGRKDEATLPPSQQAEVFIVMTQSEYDSLSKECRSNVYSQGYHFLIIDTLWVADAQMGLVFSSDKPDDIGKLTARRRLALLLGYDEGFNDLIMLDDNLKSVSCINSSQEPVDDNWTFVLNQFIEKSHQANSVLTTVQTESFKTIQKQRAKERIGWKMIYVNISLLRPLFERRQLYFLFPINLKASSEDAFFQILVHVSSQRSAPPAKGYVRFDVEEFSLCRIPHKKGRLSNICRQSGVYAQELSLQSADNQSLEPLALSILGQEKFDNLQIALCLFNNNITLNQVIRSASNLQRENYDILEALAKEELSQTDEEQWLPPVEATGFSDIVTAMADNPGFRLRDPQKECLQAIAQLSSKNDKMAVSSLPTGVGKTRIQAFTAFAYYLQHHKNSHVIVVAPTRVLSSQIVDDFLTEGNALGPEYRRHLLAVYSGAPIGQNKRVVDLPFLMANKRFREEHRGTIIVFCQASFKSLLNMAAKSGEQYHNEAKIFLRRVQMLIFDEEHLTYDPNYSAIKQLRDNDTFRSLDYVLGFSATSPIQEEYASSTLDKRAQESERRELIYLYTKNQAQDAGYIRRDRETSTTTSSIFDLIQNYPYDNNTALNEHVGIILCESQEQLEQIEQELQENIRDRQLRLQCYSVYSKKKDYSTQLANFSQTTDRSVCLVIKMLQEGYNHPAARYIINLKKYVSKRSKEQYGGRIRRKMAPNDPYTALWINVTLTDVNKKTNNVQDIDEEYYYDDDNSYCQSLDIDGPEDFEDDLNQNSNDNSGEINNTDSFDLEERPLKQLRLSAQTIDLTADEHSSSSSSSSQFKRQNKRFFVDEHTVSESPPKRCRLEERESDEEAMDVADQTEFRFSGAQIAPASNTLSQSVRQISRPDNQLEEGEIDEEAMDVADQTELRFSGAQIAPASNTLSQSVRQISRPDNQLEEGEIDEEAMDVAEQIEPTVTTAQILPAEPSAISTLHTSEQSNQADLIERALNAPNLPAGWGIAVRSRLQSQKKH